MTSPTGRERLLAAAQQLFGERGYDRTTTRDIGEAAGIDPALIARYYGGKAGLYLAALRAELGDGAPPDLLQPDRMAALLGRLDQRGPGPVFRCAVSRLDDPDVDAQAHEALHHRLVEPLRARLADAGADRPELRAELLAAAFAGVALGRTSGAFPALAALAPAELVPLLGELLGPVSEGASDAGADAGASRQVPG